MPYARQLPGRRDKVIYENPRKPDWCLGATRDRRDRSMVFFTRYEKQDLEQVRDAGPGEVVQPVHTEYKVNLRVPFVMRFVGATRMVVGEDGLATDDRRLGVRGAVQIWRTALATGALAPDVEELDDLLEYLEGAEVTVCPR